METLSQPTDLAPANEAELEDRLSRPTPAVVEALARCPGDVVILGAGGKMGPSLSRMVRRAADQLSDGRAVYAVSRFSSPDSAHVMHEAGVLPIAADLLDQSMLKRLPEAPNVIYMAGQKFGTSDQPGLTWMTNVVVPAAVAERYHGSSIVAFSTGNVYALSPVKGRSGGAREDDPVGATGEYAWSCVGRERVLEHASRTHGTRVAIVRLNYAVDLRYGVLVDIALKIMRGEPIDVRMGHVNVIWQGDANAQAIRCLPYCATPPFVINVTGPELLSVRDVAQQLGRLLGRTPIIEGTEAPDALLSDASRAQSLFGPLSVPATLLLSWVADWVRSGKRLLGKATHFEERGGAF